MKKFFAALLAAALLAALLSGCVSDKGENAEETSASKASADEAISDEAGAGMSEAEKKRLAAEQRLGKILSGELTENKALLDLPEIIQYPELPTGCESVALTIALGCFGYELEKTEIADKYLEYGASYITSYAGDPYSENGAGIYPPGLVKTAENFFEENGAELAAFETTDTELYDLYKVIEAGYPVLIWVTMYMDSPTFMGGDEYNGRFYEWYIDEHCVTLCGYDLENGTVTVSDPMRGITEYDAENLEYIFNEVGRYSMVITEL